MFERTIGREIQEGDAVTDADIYFDEREPEQEAAKDTSVEAFKLYLQRLHCESASIRSFAVLGYAALWHLDHPCLNGASQKEVAELIGVNHEVFNRAVKHWALIIGSPSPRMKLRDSTKNLLMQSSSKPMSINPMNPFARLDTIRAKAGRLEWLKKQLCLPLFNANGSFQKG